MGGIVGLSSGLAGQLESVVAGGGEGEHTPSPQQVGLAEPYVLPWQL